MSLCEQGFERLGCDPNEFVTATTAMAENPEDGTLYTPVAGNGRSTGRATGRLRRRGHHRRRRRAPADLAMLASQWWAEAPDLSANIAAERSYDGVVEIHELAAFVDQWLRTDCQ